FTATVSGFGATGTVTFKDGSTTIGSDTLTGNEATLTTAALDAGSHTITAEYGGSTFFAGNTSNEVTQVVNSSRTTTSLSATANPSLRGQLVTFTATVTRVPGGGGGGGGGSDTSRKRTNSSDATTPTGTVTFKDGGTTIGSGNVVGGDATLDISS